MVIWKEEIHYIKIKFYRLPASCWLAYCCTANKQKATTLISIFRSFRVNSTFVFSLVFISSLRPRNTEEVFLSQSRQQFIRCPKWDSETLKSNNKKKLKWMCYHQIRTIIKNHLKIKSIFAVVSLASQTRKRSKKTSDDIKIRKVSISNATEAVTARTQGAASTAEKKIFV